MQYVAVAVYMTIIVYYQFSYTSSYVWASIRKRRRNKRNVPVAKNILSYPAVPLSDRSGWIMEGLRNSTVTSVPTSSGPRPGAITEPCVSLTIKFQVLS